MMTARTATFAVLVAVAIATTVPALAQAQCTKVQLWEQCGGRSSEAGTNAPDPRYCCASGLCRRYNDFFWQCQPAGYVAPAAAVESYDASCGARTKVPFWDACGGITTYGSNASDPAICCPSGTTCQHYSDYFWQCQPAGYVPKKVVGTWSSCNSGDSIVKLWDQCGGQGYVGTACCPDESVCNVYNEFFSQCQPTGYTAPKAPAYKYASACSGNKATLWTTACGGLTSSYAQNASDPSTCCPLGSTCKIYDPTYWRCVPDYYNGPTANPNPPKAVATVVISYTLPVACAQVNLTAWSATMKSSLSANTTATVSVTSGCKDLGTRRRRLLVQTNSAEITSIAVYAGDDVSGAAAADANVQSADLKRALASTIQGANVDNIVANMNGSTRIDGQPVASPNPSPSPSPASSPSPSPNPGYYSARRRMYEDPEIDSEDDSLDILPVF